MHVAIEEWNTRREAPGLPPIRLSVGAHWGRAVLGDTVNVAARIETMTLALGCRIAVSDALVGVLRASGDPR